MVFLKRPVYGVPFSRISNRQKKSYNDDVMKLQLICQLHFKIEAYSFNAVYLNIAKLLKGLVTINFFY